MIHAVLVAVITLLLVITGTSPQVTNYPRRTGFCLHDEIYESSVDSFNAAGFVRLQEKHPTCTSDDDESNGDCTTWTFEGSTLYNLNAQQLTWMSNRTVRVLNMRSTEISRVGSDVFFPVRRTLMILDLGNATISTEDLNSLINSLRNDTADDTSYLTTLGLARISLTVIPYDALWPVRLSLEALSLSGNQFRFLGSEDSEFDAGNFPTMPALLELDIRQCNIEYIRPGSFDHLANLRKLHVSRNNIVILAGNIFHTLNHLVYLDIGYNRIQRGHPLYRHGLIISSTTFEGLDSLESLSFTHSRLLKSTVINLKQLPSSLLNLSLCDCGISETEDGLFQGLSKLRSLDLSVNYELGRHKSTRTFYGLNALEELRLSLISLSCFDSLTGLPSLRSLNLSQNSITALDSTFEHITKLEQLDLSFNFINSWKNGTIFIENENLKTVYLHSNSLSVLSEDMLTDFKSLTYLTLADNSFVCNCNLQSFVEYLLSKGSDTNENATEVIYFSSDDTSHVCTDSTLVISISWTNMRDFCNARSSQTWLVIVTRAIYIAMGIITATLSVGLLIFWKWPYIRDLMIFIKTATIAKTDDTDDKLFMYDLFVSYSEKNRDWVIDELIPNLENEDTRLGICLHERDFQVGVSIMENIIVAMDRSRIILLIITASFLDSQWCTFEMNLAQHRLLEACRGELILVLLEDIPRRKQPKTLRYLMITKTYLIWPENNEDDESKALFWKRLKRAIAIKGRERISTV